MFSSHFFRFWCCIFHWRFWVVFHGSFNLSLGDPPQFPVSQTSGWLPRFHSHIPWFSTGNIGILSRYCQNNMHWLPLCHVYRTFVLTCFLFVLTLSCAHKEGSFEHLYSSKSFALSIHPIPWQEDVLTREECIRHVAYIDAPLKK